MNKQALAFLTMFSLILMLSVYYVTLPSDKTTTVMKDENTTKKDDKSNKQTVKKENEDTSEKVEEKSNTSDSGEASKLQESIDQKKEVEINKNNEIVASDQSDETAKKNALAKIETLKSQKTLQSSIQEELIKEGYQSAIEINDSTCIVNVFEQKDDKALAKKILIKASSLTNNKYLVEVTFK